MPREYYNTRLDISVRFKPSQRAGETGIRSGRNSAYLNEMDIPTTTQLRVHPTPTHTEMLAWMRRNTTAAQKTISRPLIIV